MMKRGLVIMLATLTVPASIQAADITPANCPEPARPEVVDSVEEYNAFAREALKYRDCLLGYADEHKKQSDAHGKAANDAIKRWNKFAAERPPEPGVGGSEAKSGS